ncbi:MAG: hypothetical protein JWN62_3231 [Acidimicrobiales bacterium]|nr:hypothetical protein [Acidimicrobiales bacterium]
MEAVLRVGADAYLTHDAVLAFHELAQVNPRLIRVGTPRRVRARMPTSSRSSASRSALPTSPSTRVSPQPRSHGRSSTAATSSCATDSSTPSLQPREPDSSAHVKLDGYSTRSAMTDEHQTRHAALQPSLAANPDRQTKQRRGIYRCGASCAPPRTWPSDRCCHQASSRAHRDEAARRGTRQPVHPGLRRLTTSQNHPRREHRRTRRPVG